MPAQQQVLAIVCVQCDTLFHDDDGRYGIADDCCESCFDTLVLSCSWCSRTAPADWSRRARISELFDTDQDVPLTLSCDEDEYLCEHCGYFCDGCENLYSSEESRDECCYDDDREDRRPPGRSMMQSYSYRPHLRFHTWNGGSTLVTNQPANSNLYMGFEIELENVGEHLDAALTLVGEDGYTARKIYAKSDGSLSYRGVEIVSQPMDLESIRSTFPFAALNYLHENGARGWAYPNCGMHVHVSRSAFTPPHLYKFIRFQVLNAGMCIAFAGRNSEQWSSWSNETSEEMRIKTSKYVKDGTWGARYSAINICNTETVELRYFRSNILPSGVIRVAEFIQAMYDYTKSLSVKEIMTNGWEEAPFIEWMSNRPQFANAADYMNRVRWNADLTTGE